MSNKQTLDHVLDLLYEEEGVSYKKMFGGFGLFKNEILLVIEKKGRPLSFSKKEKWDLYDVYYVAYENKIYEFLHVCLTVINNSVYDIKF